MKRKRRRRWRKTLRGKVTANQTQRVWLRGNPRASKCVICYFDSSSWGDGLDKVTSSSCLGIPLLASLKHQEMENSHLPSKSLQLSSSLMVEIKHKEHCWIFKLLGGSFYWGKKSQWENVGKMHMVPRKDPHLSLQAFSVYEAKADHLKFLSLLGWVVSGETTEWRKWHIGIRPEQCCREHRCFLNSGWLSQHLSLLHQFTYLGHTPRPDKGWPYDQTEKGKGPRKVHDWISLESETQRINGIGVVRWEWTLNVWQNCKEFCAF